MYAALTKHGWAARSISTKQLPDLKAEIEGHHRRKLYAGAFNAMLERHLSFALPPTLPAARSIVIVAVPAPTVRVSFVVDGRAHEFIVPPQYAHHTEAKDAVRATLAETVASRGFGLESAARLPLKLLAAGSGLGMYGRNNIVYVPTMGSHHQLVAFFSDAPSADDWDEPLVMARCQDCPACVKACPTAAIAGERFLLHAERCLTFFNEDPGDFPDWIDPRWHNALVGCVECQRVCPANAEVADERRPLIEFDAGETQALVSGARLEQLAPPTVAKLVDAGLYECIEALPRNLAALLALA
jgi:epoxyqueuosine reductase